nr:hypothetical protein [Georgenia yuyongxinii]
MWVGDAGVEVDAEGWGAVAGSFDLEALAFAFVGQVFESGANIEKTSSNTA